MTEQTAPGVGGDQIEFPGCIQFEQRLPPEASPQGNGAPRDVFTGRSASGPEAGPAGDSTEFAASARLIAAADDAKRRIERDLHDGLQQRLVLLGLQARLAEASVARDQQELKCELALIAEGLLEALETLREISRGIHPAILSTAGWALRYRRWRAAAQFRSRWIWLSTDDCLIQSRWLPTMWSPKP